MKKYNKLLVFGLGAYLAGQAYSAGAEQIGSVDTAWKMVGPNHKIVVEAFDDPKIQGVACHLSRAKKGGVTGLVGLAEDTADASIACRQIGPIDQGLVSKLKAGEGEEVFSQSTSPLFKTMHVMRFYDSKRNTLVYLVYSDKLIDGSPKNSISTVPVMPWK